jgi:hypothetical protein
VIAGSFPLLPFNENARAQQATVAYTASAASWIDETPVSFTRLSVLDVPQCPFNPDFAPFFGIIVATGDPRRLQFALRYDW